MPPFISAYTISNFSTHPIGQKSCDMQSMQNFVMMCSSVTTETVWIKFGYVTVIMTVETTVMKTNVVCGLGLGLYLMLYTLL